MTNLLEETIEAIKNSKHRMSDILFIGSARSGHSCTWKKFCLLADREYNSGFGAQKVAIDLIIVFKDGARIYRVERDGSECWSYVEPFVAPAKPLKKIESLFVTDGAWQSLAEIHQFLEG